MRSALWILGISAALTTGLMQRAHAQDIAYVVSYFEAAPAAKDQAATLARQFGEQSRKDDGNLRFEVLQRLNPSNHFAIVEAWRDAKADLVELETGTRPAWAARPVETATADRDGTDEPQGVEGGADADADVD